MRREKLVATKDQGFTLSPAPKTWWTRKETVGIASMTPAGSGSCSFGLNTSRSESSASIGERRRKVPGARKLRFLVHLAIGGGDQLGHGVVADRHAVALVAAALKEIGGRHLVAKHVREAD